jgi:hypothetical protein
MQTLTIADASRLTGKHPDTIRRLIKRLLKEDSNAQKNIKQELVNGGFSYHISKDYLLEHMQTPSATVEMPMQQPRHTDTHTKFAEGQHTPQDNLDRSKQPHEDMYTDRQVPPQQVQHADMQLLRETINILKEQLREKDKQIEQFLERDRETNILLKGYQNRYLIEAPKEKREEKAEDGEAIVVKPKHKQPQKPKAQKQEQPAKKGLFSFLRRK